MAKPATSPPPASASAPDSAISAAAAPACHPQRRAMAAARSCAPLRSGICAMPRSAPVAAKAVPPSAMRRPDSHHSGRRVNCPDTSAP